MNDKNADSPATKRDIENMLETVMKAVQDIERRMATKENLFEMATKDDLLGMVTKEDLRESERRMFVVMENLRVDLVDMHKDTRSLHEDRFKRIEDHIGLAA